MNDLPEDFARPRDTGRASLIANVTIAAVLILVNLGLLAYALLAVDW